MALFVKISVQSISEIFTMVHTYTGFLEHMCMMKFVDCGLATYSNIGKQIGLPNEEDKE